MLEERPHPADRLAKEVPRDVAIAATNRDLRSEVVGGGFREDLLLPSEVLTIEILPQRLRAGDIAVLAAHFNRLLSVCLGLPPLAITPEVAARWSPTALLAQREPRNLVERLADPRRSVSGAMPVGGEPLPLSLR